MSAVIPQRITAEFDEPMVVFLIGVRINRLLAVRHWLPVFMAMPPMQRELAAHPEKGVLGSRLYLSGRVLLYVMYWRSFDQLEAFARDKDDLHLPAWQKFNREAAKSRAVGIFHETYLVEPGNVDCVYNNMPAFGLAAATKAVPAVGRRETARRRIGGESEPAVPVYE